MSWHPLVAALSLPVIAACSTPSPPSPELHYDEAQVTILLDPRRNFDDMTIDIKPETARNFCPPPLDVEVTVDGVLGDQWNQGGRQQDEVDSKPYCDELSFRAPFTAGTRDLEITFASTDEPEVSTWRIAIEWDNAAEVWADDDVEAAVQADEPFSVRWSPEDAPPPTVQFQGLPALLDFLGPTEDIALETVDVSPGLMRVRLASKPSKPWSVYAMYNVYGAPSVCEGFARCTVNGTSIFPLTQNITPPP